MGEGAHHWRASLPASRKIPSPLWGEGGDEGYILMEGKPTGEPKTTNRLKSFADNCRGDPPGRPYFADFSRRRLAWFVCARL